MLSFQERNVPTLDLLGDDNILLGFLSPAKFNVDNLISEMVNGKR